MTSLNRLCCSMLQGLSPDNRLSGYGLLDPKTLGLCATGFACAAVGNQPCRNTGRVRAAPLQILTRLYRLQGLVASLGGVIRESEERQDAVSYWRWAGRFTKCLVRVPFHDLL